MKTSKKVISLILVAIMLMSNFAGLDLDLDFTIEADAAIADDYQTQYDPTNMDTSITLTDGNWGVTQKRVVSNYQSVYDGYRERFFTGRESNEPTNLVIPGLLGSDDFVTQGMTYWKEKDWFLISSYHDPGTKNSVIMAVDAKTGKFVALYKLQNADGSMNLSHGGGIAASEHNFYYADTASTISYVPLSELDVPKGTVKYLTMKGTVDFAGEMKGVATSYCCYDDGYLWAGNFYRAGSDYDNDYTTDYPSVLVGYQLQGDSSEEEWANLQNTTNFISVTTESAQTVNGGSYTVTVESTDADGNVTTTTENRTQSMSYTTTSSTDESTGKMNIGITGTVSNVNNAPSKQSEFTANFGSFSLIEGQSYTVSFKSTNANSDMFLFAPNGKHCNVKPAGVFANADGTYTYSLTFTAGLRPQFTGLDSTWPTTQSTDGSYTGRYTIRFDQDNPSDGSFTLSDVKVVPSAVRETRGYAGNPSELVVFGGGLDNLQYAIVHQGKVYLSRSWGRGGTVYELVIGEMDLGVPGEVSLLINGSTRYCHLIDASTDLTRFGNDQMFLMSEAICIVDDYLYMDMESACDKYMNGTLLEGGSCDEPIDVIWRIDQRKILNEYREVDDASAAYYEKVYDLTTLKETDEVIVVHKSNLTDSFTQLPIIYALDSTGGYNGNYLPKQNVSGASAIGDNFGMIGKEIDNYSYEDNEDILIIDEELDAHKGMRWRITDPADTSSTGFRLENLHPYFSTYKYLYFGSRALTMSSNDRAALYNLKLEKFNDEGDFRFFYQSKNDDGTLNNPYYLWCNDGSDKTINTVYNTYYQKHGISGYDPTYHKSTEIPGTFHTDGDLLASGSSSNASGNLTGAAVPVDYQLFNVYKRVRDSYSSTYDSRIYTDLDADLQADGTYNINMETYAINQRPLVPTAAKPTDFVLVLDTSGSMKNSDFMVLKYYYVANGNNLSMSRVAGMDNEDFYKKSTTLVKQSAGNVYYAAPDGKIHLLYVDVETGGGNIFNNPTSQSWLYYIDEGKTYYYNSSNDGTWTSSTTRPSTASFSAKANDTSGRNDKSKANIDHAAYDEGQTRLVGMQNTVCEFIDRVSAEIAETGLNHKIAVVQYGSDGNDTNSTAWRNTGFYNTSGTTMISYNGATTAQYQTALYSQDQFEQLKTIVNSFDVTTEDPDTYVNYGMEMAKNILANSPDTYLSDGSRSAAVIMMTDGVPGLGKDDSNKDTVANNAIDYAYEIKHNQGGFVYSVQLGDASGDYANMGKYLDYISSEYPAARSLTASGDPDIQEIVYHHDVKFGDVSLTNLVSNMFVDIKTNSTNSIAILEEDTIIKEHLSNRFIIPEDVEVKVYTADAYYDELHRLQFDTPVATTSYSTSISADDTGDDRIIQVSGFNYSTEYVSLNRPNLTGNGKKLIVSIEGVLPKETGNAKDLINAPINVDDTTGVYENAEHVAANEPVKKFPVSHFSIPEYTYVLDYNLPMRDTDVNGEPLAISPTLSAQDVNNYNKSLAAADVTDGVGLEIEATNGVGDNLIYSLNGVDDGNISDNKGYVLIQRDDGSYDWFRINVVPASNVMYEETSFTGEGNRNVNWEDSGTAINTHQSLSTQYDIYGYDDRFDEPNGTHSNGTVKTVTVDKTNNKSDNAAFTFTGTGFDLISTCGPNTGIQVVALRKVNADGSVVNTPIKTAIVDTYYNDTYGTLTQVPIVSYRGLEHGTYQVTTAAAYLSSSGAFKGATTANTILNRLGITQKTVDVCLNDSDAIFKSLGMTELIGCDTDMIYMDDNSILNGGTGVQAAKSSKAKADYGVISLVNYIDGIRIYEPLGDDYSDYIESEQGATYYNIVKSLTESTADSIIQSTGTSFFGYGELNAGKEFIFADYKASSAPKHEIYLSGGSSEAISFKVHEAANVMISMRAVSGQAVPVINGTTFSVNSASEMYYDITPYLGEATDGYYTVSVSNGGADSLLAINNLKIVNGNTSAHSLMALSVEDAPMVASLMSLEPVEVEINQPQPFKTKYPDYVPEKGTDSDVDDDVVEDVTPDDSTEPSTPTIPDDAVNVDFAQNLLAKLIQLIMSIFSMLGI